MRQQLTPKETIKLRGTGGSYPVVRAVYIATIDEHPNLIKVGCSMYVHDRMKQLSSYYKLNFRLHSFYPELLELDIHKMLADFQYSGKFSEARKTGKEIFKCSIDEVVSAVNAVKEIKYNYKRVK